MLFLASMPLHQGVPLALFVLVGLLMFVGWVFWKINPPRF